MGDIFKFKQFHVNQEGCSMKINTDAVLIAAKSDTSGVNHILDIGTGTGVIALMLAQRCPHAYVHALDIDRGAFECARSNFENSPFADRLSISLEGIESFESDSKFDLIVSNPPYFINSLKNKNDRKALARHGSILFYEYLFSKSSLYLSADGVLNIIWPLDVRDTVVNQGLSDKFTIVKELYIQSFEHSKPFRVISSFKLSQLSTYKADSFYIYEEPKKYTDGYKQLLSPFFINY